MSLAQKFNRTFGAVYVAIGIVGFVELVGGTTSQTGSKLLGIFGVTLVHNLVHLGVGAAFLAGSSTDDNARKTALAIGAVYLLVGVIGLFGIGFVNDLLFINGADNVLHFATGALAVAVGSGRVAATA
jgi:hypothetical protein